MWHQESLTAATEYPPPATEYLPPPPSTPASSHGPQTERRPAPRGSGS